MATTTVTALMMVVADLVTPAALAVTVSMTIKVVAMPVKTTMAGTTVVAAVALKAEVVLKTRARMVRTNTTTLPDSTDLVAKAKAARVKAVVELSEVQPPSNVQQRQMHGRVGS